MFARSDTPDRTIGFVRSLVGKQHGFDPSPQFGVVTAGSAS